LRRAVIALLPRPRVLRVDGGWGPRKSRGHLGLRILESYSRRKEPSGPKRARPLPRGVYASAVSLKPLGSRTKIRLSLGKVQPLSCLRRSRQRDPPIRSGNVTPTGEAAELGEHDALCEPGPGIWPLRLAKCQRWGEDGRSPGFRTFLQLRRDKIKRSIKDLLATLERRCAYFDIASHQYVIGFLTDVDPPKRFSLVVQGRDVPIRLQP